MTTRKGKIVDIDAVARGRIFSADQAKDKGMVDQIGGIQESITYAATKSSLKPGDYDVRVFPAPRTLADLLNGQSSEDSSSSRFVPRMIPSEAMGLFSVLSPGAREALSTELTELTLFQKSPVILASPVIFVVH
jgi:protease-4